MTTESKTTKRPFWKYAKPHEILSPSEYDGMMWQCANCGMVHDNGGPGVCDCPGIGLHEDHRGESGAVVLS